MLVVFSYFQQTSAKLSTQQTHNVSEKKVNKVPNKRLPNWQFSCTTKLWCQYLTVLVQSDKLPLELVLIHNCTSLFLSHLNKQPKSCNSCFLLAYDPTQLPLRSHASWKYKSLHPRYDISNRKLLFNTTFAVGLRNDATVPHFILYRHDAEWDLNNCDDSGISRWNKEGAAGFSITKCDKKNVWNNAKKQRSAEYWSRNF